ncbi:orotate phosphoribosyltransferase [candidate division NPL-UPA2 bacterium Unc8]|uniref:Orotate phosphoribosyltransferase n=1 Tax=candidate division NPL-UPA2 bacterium Unc8 TaxID=1980939 RepID=A0A399FVK7_UNCN2|nr:Orotate phosphoribosyltransferase [Bacillota bacterium]MBT9137861.1 Orotate phosphoribosyltransferase [Bacillota bacterium]MBT9146474.1 Orotate phosphoribosyltransferase [Bacillota bacterium]RII00214.1 MAG: orotate phosphoribosyltransferase [candidate division NPL-UPA2 bacterium Unc8]
MTEEEVLLILEKTGALLKGHFRLSSGLHGSEYVQMALVLSYPAYASRLGEALAQRFASKKIDIVIGPALGGIILSYEVGRALGKRAIFAEKENGIFKLRRGFYVQKGENVLVVEDVTTTGGSALEIVTLIKELGGVIAGVGSLVDRSTEGSQLLALNHQALIHLSLESYRQEECPLCKEGIPVEKPGSG